MAYRRRMYRRRPTKRRRIARSLRTRRRRIGERVGSSRCKVVEVYVDNGHSTQQPTDLVKWDTRQLYYAGMILCSQGATRINDRLTNRINVRGVRFQATMTNNLPGPLLVNVAVISIKDWSGWDDQGIGPSETNFLRGYNEERGISVGDSNFSLENHLNGINNDLYVVLKHKRYMLGGTSATAFNSPNKSSWRKMDWYIPLRRQIRFDADDSIIPSEGQLFWCVWCDKWQERDGGGITNDAITKQVRTLMYFKDPK